MTEQDLIKGCQRGKAKYQRQLVLRYSPMLMTVARRYATDGHTAQDILQDAFIRILQYIDRYQPTGSFEGWMRRIVINVALRALEKSKKIRWQNPDDVPSQMPSLSPQVYSHLGAEALIELVNRLPDGSRQVFNLYVIEGFDHKEIGQLLGISASTSRSQLLRARQRLQELIVQREKISYAS